MKPEKDCISIIGEPRQQRPDIILHPTETDGKADTQIIQVGCDMPVVLQKMFGPLIFCDLRIWADPETCEWVIERENINTLEWTEAARLPGQIESEFQDE